ncbi:E3 ubiquitin-protein ligase Topors [Silurus asotus]|uniref:E3 ubiquitin-protein ligase Topors n=1 Tax=Silurus asotus TaxID=30991 RepID=A0AAD5A631_SILAS|nr:E3 ubiquitin-protein ligase Topors [Silurus asotus]
MMASVEQDADMQMMCAADETVCEETSPDSKCPICLERFKNVSYADRCFHRFCFRCIVEWGKNKAECPLCKQPFSSIYHSVRSEDDFRLYQLRPSHHSSFGCVEGQRFRYRTTLTHQRRREGPARGTSYRQEVMRFRRWLYRRGVRVRGVRDGGRSRDTSAEFFRKNPACLHRLVPWLKRELAVIYGSHDSVADVVLHVILSLLTRHDMQGEAFLRELRSFLSSRTEHFLHEFLSFAKAPFNMEAYDHHAVYDCPAPSHLPAISEDDADLNSAPSPWDDETPGPSYSTTTRSVFTVTISDSDVDSGSEDEESARVGADAGANSNVSGTRVEEDEDDHSIDEDCVIVGFIKPIAQRTPELVQLSSDSEVSEQEEPGPSASNQLQARDLTNQRSPGKGSTHSAPENRHRDYSSHGHRRHSHSHRKRSKATNHSSPSYTRSHTHSYTHSHCSRHTPQPSRAYSGSRTRARSRSRTHARSSLRTRARSSSRTRARSSSRTRARSRSRTRARSSSRTRARSRSRTRARSRSRTRARSRSRSRTRARSRSRSRTRARSRSRTLARSRSRTLARSRSRTRARSRSRTRARSRSRTRARSRSRTRARSRSRSKTHARSSSRTRACSYSKRWRAHASLQHTNRLELLSVSPSPSSHRSFSHEKASGKQKRKSLPEEEKKRRSREKHHHHLKKKKKKKSGRRSSSMEFGADVRKHHKRKKKHKRKRQSERRGRSLGTHPPADVTTLTDTQSTEEATPLNGAAATNTETTRTPSHTPSHSPSHTPSPSNTHNFKHTISPPSS